MPVEGENDLRQSFCNILSISSASEARFCFREEISGKGEAFHFHREENQD